MTRMRSHDCVSARVTLGCLSTGATLEGVLAKALHWLIVLFGGVLLLTALVAARPAQALELPDFTSLVKNNHEAVVNISISQASMFSQERQSPGGPGNEELDDLFRRYEELPGAPSDASATGSGFIISADGYILTNNHVVESADQVTVRLHDRRQLSAEVIGSDARSDIAVLKVEADDLPVVSIGNSDALEVGEWVLAIGSPFGFDFSVTAGIVSATGRALPNESYVPFIQTDVAINPGNSGGPLFNLDGDVIGVNSQIYSRTGSFMGLSFAIPIEMAIDVANQIRQTGGVTRGWLGVMIQEVTMELAESFGMDVAHGALVTSILEDSPASQSSLLVGDVITHFEGTRIERSSSLPPLVGRVPANSDAALKVMREGNTIELSVNIGELPSANDLRQSLAPSPAPTIRNALKLTVKPLDAQTRTALGIDKGGVLVESVAENGPAANAGIIEGDVISMVDNKPVDSARDLLEVLSEMEGRQNVAVLVHRDSGPVFLALQLAP